MLLKVKVSDDNAKFSLNVLHKFWTTDYNIVNKKNCVSNPIIKL